MTELRIACGKCEATFKIKAPAAPTDDRKQIRFKCKKCGHLFELVAEADKWRIEGGQILADPASAIKPSNPAGGPPSKELPLPPPPAAARQAVRAPKPAPAATAKQEPAVPKLPPPPAIAAAPRPAAPSPPPDPVQAAPSPPPDPAQPLDEEAFREPTPVKDVKKALTQSGLAKLNAGRPAGQPGGSRRALWVALGVVALAAAGLGTWALWPPSARQDQTAPPDEGPNAVASLGPDTRPAAAEEPPAGQAPDAGAADAAAASEAADAGAAEPAGDPQAGRVAAAEAAEPPPKDKRAPPVKKHKHRVASVEPKPDRPIQRDQPAPIKLTRVEIFKVLRKHGKAFQDCALDYLAKQGPGSKVSIVLKLTIASSGAIQMVKVDPPPIEDTSLGRCLLMYARKLRFPRHVDKSVSIAFPLEFQAVAQ